NKKEFKKPSHSITAYRILQNEKVLEKKNDDGETGAGIRLLELLRKRNIENILVIVFRWYGGIHLGSDRFRHILSVGEASLPED
ncbi:MAG TPA: YigZ family protein, partial [Firmicutes bacterium]|nr:YigZ family protein [Bacillota bacterium]